MSCLEVSSQLQLQIFLQHTQARFIPNT